jgi:hypothetical protein
MALLSNNNPITANGTYDVPNMVPGKRYLLTIKGFISTAEMVLLANCGPNRSFEPIENSELSQNRTELRFVAPSTTLRLSVIGEYSPDGSPSIQVTIIPIY